MAEKSIEQMVKELMVERLFLKISPEQIADDEDIVKTLGVDSLGVFEIVISLEETYGMSFENEEFRIENFQTPHTIAECVRRNLAADPCRKQQAESEQR